MATLKTLKNSASVIQFIDSVDDLQKKEDAHVLLKIFEDITKEKASMRGTSIIWFGQYHYKSERSKQEWDWPLIGFSPRKANITLYLMWWLNDYTDLIEKIWKCKTSKGSCLYIKRLSDIDIEVLKEIIKSSFIDMKKKYAMS